MNPDYDKIRTELSARMSKMTRKEKDELYEKSLERIYPAGYWNCDCLVEANPHVIHHTAVGEKCQFCGKNCGKSVDSDK